MYMYLHPFYVVWCANGTYFIPFEAHGGYLDEGTRTGEDDNHCLPHLYTVHSHYNTHRYITNLASCNHPTFTQHALT